LRSFGTMSSAQAVDRPATRGNVAEPVGFSVKPATGQWLYTLPARSGSRSFRSCQRFSSFARSQAAGSFLSRRRRGYPRLGISMRSFGQRHHRSPAHRHGAVPRRPGFVGDPYLTPARRLEEDDLFVNGRFTRRPRLGRMIHMSPCWKRVRWRHPRRPQSGGGNFTTNSAVR
jgi:hypothetical protein